jgi:predicted dehydrogenase
MTSLAFAGAGWVTAVHGLAATGVDDLSVVHVASRTPRSAKRRADQVGAVPCRYDELPGGADAVVVATPPRLHLREAQRAVNGGAAVLVEAPLATTLAAADDLVALAEGGALVAYGENLVHSPAVAEAVRMVRDLGPLTFLEVRLAQGRPDRRSHLASGWGGGALFDLGSHAVAVALLLAAPARVVEVEAEVSGRDDLVVDDDATVRLTFDSGLRAQVRATWRAPAPSWDAQAATADAAVRLELVPEPTVEVNGVALPLPAADAALVSPQLHHLGYVAQLETLAADIEAGRAPQCGPAFGRLVLDIVCAAYTSAGRGRPEPVPFTGRRDRTPHSLWRLPEGPPADTPPPETPPAETASDGAGAAPPGPAAAPDAAPASPPQAQGPEPG